MFATVDDPMAVRADQREVIDMGSVSLGEAGNWFHVMAFNKSFAPLAIMIREIEVTRFTNQFPIPRHGLLAFAFAKMAVALAYNMHPS